jgi:hypothetical protein
MTSRTSVAAMLAELEDLKAAMAEAKLATGQIEIVIVNDCEDEALLAPYRRNLNQLETFEIGDTVQPEPRR